MQRVLDVREHHTAAAIEQEIRALGDPATARTWQLAKDAQELERRTAVPLVSARLALIEQMTEMLDENVVLPDLLEVLLSNPWLVDLRFDRAATRPLDPKEGSGEATILVGPPAWDLEARPTIISACWDESTRPSSDKEWLRVTQGREEGPSDVLLVARVPSEVAAGNATTWHACLARTHRQHQAWHSLVREEPRP
jgi:hypothetical protein